MPVSVWEALFMLVVLKIPLVYVGLVVLWAIRATPVQTDGGDGARIVVPLTPCGWSEWQRRRSGRRPVRPFGPAFRRARAVTR